MEGTAALKPEPTRRVTVGRWTAELLPRQAYEARYTADRALLGFAFESQEGMHAYAGDRIRPFRAKPNGLAYVPEGCDVYSRSPAGGEYLAVTGFDLDVSIDLPFSDRTDPPAIAAAQATRRLLLAFPAADPLHFEALMGFLIERLHVQIRGRQAPTDSARWMTTQRLRRIDDFIETRLDLTLTVQDLADELGLSAGFFSRVFRQATGRSPHSYILDRRIARARALIAAGTEDLSAVALAAGFSSHAHLTTVFRQKLGVSPRVLRANLLTPHPPQAS
ncbi:AraC family transcriptional regulator [Ciceribacter ferrooxidans]|uniref:AraC family transcriptional regulator n=1 Tax=Ciceribacter ferrooxidans TaxID=2509717 RepID=A0A4Q2T9G7_9HYPH|nr:AraC family transcriptional regulator [Ciceribacter ferrooxidans]